MEKKTFSYKRACQRIYLYLVDSLEKGKSLQRISEGLRNIVNSYFGLNRNDKYRIYLTAYNLARAAKTSKSWEKKLSEKTSFDTLITACRVVKSKSNTRMKQARIRAYLGDNDKVFFICSQHEKPAEDHRDYQGKIYVDRFWRTKVSGTMYYAVSSYIKNHNVVTVQEIMREPVWLTTRPNCKHYFIPLQTASVLHRSARSIREEIGYRKDLPWTERERGELRQQIFSSLNEAHPCLEFKKIGGH